MYLNMKKNINIKITNNNNKRNNISSCNAATKFVFNTNINKKNENIRDNNKEINKSKENNNINNDKVKSFDILELKDFN